MFKKYEYRKFELSLVKDKESKKATCWALVSDNNIIHKYFDLDDKKTILSYITKRTKLTKNKYFSFKKEIPLKNNILKYEFQILDKNNKIKAAAY